MNAYPSFNQSLMVGFDELEKILCQVAKSGESFPPYNIEQVDDNTLTISLAVAGYTYEDLEVAIEDSQLVIRGRQEVDSERKYLHKGIAARSFVKTFILAEGMKAAEVLLENGLLNIILYRPERKIKRTKLIISTPECRPCLLEAKEKK